MERGSLQKRGALVLISCYELGHQPLGLAFLAAFLERAGFQPDCLDTSVEGVDWKRLKHAEFIGISVPMHTALRVGAELARRIREVNPSCHICFFGLYASLNADYLLNETADSVVGGEYEEALVALVSDLDEGRSPHIGSTREFVPVARRQLSFPTPQRTLLPRLEKYVRLEKGTERLAVGYTQASRGCKHLCLHCPIPPVYLGRFFTIPRDVVLGDIRQLVEAGARHITFGDPDFLNGPGHSLRIVKAMHEEFPQLTFDFTAKIEHLIRHENLIHEFVRLGCLFVVSAVESLSDTVLVQLEKGHTRADVFVALNITRNAGIVLRPSLVSFTPWTTLDDYLDVLQVVEAEGLCEHVDSIQYAIRLLVPPGSLLASSPGMRPHLGELLPDQFTYRWTHPDPRMDQLYKKVMTLVEESVTRNEDPWSTFVRIERCASALRSGQPERTSPILPRHATRAVRLSEPWFC